MPWGRIYFAVQAVAGAAWWLGVFTVPFVRVLTLGGLDPVVVAILDIPLFVVASALAAFGLRGAAVLATAWTILVAVALAAYATLSGAAGWGVLIMAAAAAGSSVAVSLMLFGRVQTSWIASGPFAFRTADAHASTAAHIGRTAAQILLFWGLFLGVIPLAITFFEHRWGVAISLPGVVSTWAGLTLFILASVVGLWSALAMSTRGGGTPLPSVMANRLVIAGPYRFVRNPMAVAGIAQGVAVGLLLSSWPVVAYAVIGSIVWNVAIRPLEEADLEARFGAEFRRYRAEVRCWVPRSLRPASTPSTCASTAARRS